jgi:O-antigen ligase
MKYAEELFSVIGSGLFGLLLAAVLMHGAVRKSLRISAVDLLAIALSFWCVAVYLIYFETSKSSEVIKMVIPLLSYTVVKNVVKDRREYIRLVKWMIVGFSLPTVLSAVLIMIGSPTALDVVNYWTQIARWEGVYTHPHNLGLSMTLFISVLILYVIMRETVAAEKQTSSRYFENTVLVLLGIVALYCLYKSQVRTAVVGLLTFLAVYWYAENKRLMLIGTAVIAVVAIVTASYWLEAFNPELGAVAQGKELATTDIGSGRVGFWLHDLTVYAGLPLDQQLAGAAIGADRAASEGTELLGHNDWLDVLTRTGLVGFVLFLSLQIAILRAILRMQGRERYAFMAMFVAVTIMMGVSNAVVWRIQVSHLYYILYAYIEISPYRQETADTEMQGTRAIRGNSQKARG